MDPEETNLVEAEPSPEVEDVLETEVELDDEGNPVEPEPEPDDSEEIELGDKKVRIPKEVKPLLMMQADYTKKTQEIAREREALAASKAQQAETFEALRAEYGAAHALEAQVRAYEAVDWAAYRAQDPDSARLDYDRYREIKDQHNDAKSSLTQKEQARLEEARQAADNHLKETGAELARSIPGWNADVASNIVSYAEKELGLPIDELKQSDARAWKAIHRLIAAETELAALKSKQTTAKNLQKAAEVQPAAKPKGTFAPAGLHDKLPAEEWTRRRNAELAAKAGR